jgi:radical SAM superfamily enzyme YgiQ (UPF0313 family)
MTSTPTLEAAAPDLPFHRATPEEAARRIRTPDMKVAGPPVLLVTLYDGLMNHSLRPLYAALTGEGHLAKVMHFGKTVAYEHDLDYSLFQTLKVKFPLARPSATDEELAAFANWVRELSPCIAGFNVIAPLGEIAARLTRIVREVSGAHVVWGGYMAINEPEWCLQHADSVCVGEGEQLIVELTNAIKSGEEDFTHIAGLWWKNGDGAVQRNSRRALMEPGEWEKLPLLFCERTGDEIMIPADMIQWYDHGLNKSDGGNANSATVVHDVSFSRGCFFGCTYCHHNVHHPRERGMGAYYRSPSPEWAVEQCKDAKYRLGKKRLLIWDDVFPVDTEWVRRFATLYREEVGLPFSLNFHPKLLREENVDLLVAAGMDACNLGFQSGSPAIREIFGRHETNEQIVANARLMHGKVCVCYDTIIDNPFETADDVRQSFLLFLQFPHPFIVDTNTLLFFRHQELTNRALAEGIITGEQVLGVRPGRDLDDATVTPFRPRTDPAKRAYTMLMLATQYEFIPKETLLEWSEDPELIADDRLLALKILQRLYAHARERMWDYQWHMLHFLQLARDNGARV